LNSQYSGDDTLRGADGDDSLDSGAGNRELKETLAEHFGITPEVRQHMLPSGQHTTFHNRVAWSKTYLERAGILKNVRRGHFTITDRGREILNSSLEHINNAFLRQFPEFNAFRAGTNGSDEFDEAVALGPDTTDDQTPEEALQIAYQRIRDDLAAELIDQIKTMSPTVFEQLVLDLMVRMGYGGARDSTAFLTSGGSDGGIDGVINEDQLGLDIVYLQAKRWENQAGRPEIQRFVGALHRKRARKGVFLTTSTFSRDAHDYVATIDPKVVLIDGPRLAQLMIDFGVGVSTSPTYALKRIDSDYFTED
jgi:restriction system protein